jgi:hypothetical protein
VVKCLQLGGLTKLSGKMPSVGSEQKPVIISSKNKKKKRILGLTGKFYTKEEQSQYAEGWDRIFNKKKK